jgi:hypothetical protein
MCGLLYLLLEHHIRVPKNDLARQVSPFLSTQRAVNPDVGLWENLHIRRNKAQTALALHHETLRL